MSLRVAMVGLRAPWGVEGGVEQSVAELAPRLARLGCEVTVYCRGRYNPHGPGVREGVRLVDTPTVYSRSFEALVHTAVALPRAAARHDLVHVHACGPALFSPIPRALGRRTVVTIHGKDWEREKWGPLARAMLRTGAAVAGNVADAVIAVSRNLCEWYAAHYPAPVRFIPNGVSAHTHQAWEASAFPMLRPGQYHLYLGRLVPEKGLETLLDAVARRAPAWPVVLTGGSAYTDAYVGRLRRRAPEGIVFTGPRFGLEKRMLLSHARSFVFPSRIEGFPIALLEAMAAGLPIAASDIPPNLEALGDVGGWRLPVGDVDAWAAAIAEIEGASPDFLAGIGARARRRALDCFSWEQVAEETLDVYRSARGHAGGRAVA